MVSTLTVLLGGDVTSVATLFTPFTAMVFLIFTLLYTPCVAAIATVKREMGGTKAAVITVSHRMGCCISGARSWISIRRGINGCFINQSINEVLIAKKIQKST